MTAFSDVYDAFFNKMEEDSDFFDYFNLTRSQAMEVAKERAHSYLKEAIAVIERRMEVDDTADFMDCDDETARFNWDLSIDEIDMLASFMYEQYFKRQYSKLKAFDMQHVPSTLQVFSPANERKTVRNMLSDMHEENMTMLDNYMAKDRATRKFKTLDYDDLSSDD
nr:MAG TPA: hypothetical protein [Caudoviricetes sp.]DAM63814.1 MAG TPA: hypothetical protein [Caudoviricetes sp.]